MMFNVESSYWIGWCNYAGIYVSMFGRIYIYSCVGHTYIMSGACS